MYRVYVMILKKGGHKMDIYSFINSESIKEYLDKINYQFSIADAFYIVQHSRQKSFEEKQTAYTEILQRAQSNDTIHKLIKEYKPLEIKLAKAFFKPEDAVFSNYRSLYGYETEPFAWCNLYHDAQLCFTDNIGSSDTLVITKHYIKNSEENEDYKSIRAEFSNDGVLVYIDELNYLSYNEREVVKQVYQLAETLDIPVPFKNGDLIVDASGNELIFKNICKHDNRQFAIVSENGETFSSLGYLDFEFKYRQ